jgi:hypothetical protein
MSDTPDTAADTTAATTRYLSRLEHALRRVSKDDRSAIVAEIGSHIAERSLKPNANLSEILKSLGEPQDLARAFVEQSMLSEALQRSAPGPLLAAILSRATRSFVAFSAGLGGVISYMFALSFTIVSIMKPISPQNVGLWWGGRMPSFGYLASPPRHAAELLGLWIVPISLIAAILCYVAGTTLMKWGARILLRRAAAFPTLQRVSGSHGSFNRSDGPER